MLSRSRLRQDFPLLTDEKVESLIETLLLKGRLFRNVPKRFELLRDPDDEPYLNLAIEANAQVLVTRDRDLLDLMKWDTKEGRLSVSIELRIGSCRLLKTLETE